MTAATAAAAITAALTAAALVAVVLVAAAAAAAAAAKRRRGCGQGGHAHICTDAQSEAAEDGNPAIVILHAWRMQQDRDEALVTSPIHSATHLCHSC